MKFMKIGMLGALLDNEILPNLSIREKRLHFSKRESQFSALWSLSSVIAENEFRINLSASNLVMHFFKMRNLGAFLFKIGLNGILGG